MFDMMTMVGIDMIAVRLAIEIDDTVAPITLFTDELVSKAITEFFSDEEEWHADLLPVALTEYRETQAAHDAAQAFASSLFEGMFSGALRSSSRWR